MNNIQDYIDQKDYHQAMMYDQWQEKCHDLEIELLKAKIKLNSAEVSAESWKEAYYKLESLLHKE